MTLTHATTCRTRSYARAAAAVRREGTRPADRPDHHDQRLEPGRRHLPPRARPLDPRDRADRAEAFRALHHGPTPLVLPNAWDAAQRPGDRRAGYPAIATSSAAVARASATTTASRPRRTRCSTRSPGSPARSTYRSPPTSRRGTGCDPRSSSSVCWPPARSAATWRTRTRVRAHWSIRSRQADYLAAVRAAAGADLVINARVDSFIDGATADDGDRPRPRLPRGRRRLRLPDLRPGRALARTGGRHRRTDQRPVPPRRTVPSRARRTRGRSDHLRRRPAPPDHRGDQRLGGRDGQVRSGGVLRRLTAWQAPH